MIEIKNLSKNFNERTVLKDITFTADKEVFTLLGPNGAGKTTLVNIICGLIPWNNGTVQVNGIDPQKNPSQVRKHIGLVTQETALYEYLTARENLEFHARFYGVKTSQRSRCIKEALQFSQLEDRANDSVSTFSGGMKRRLALARSIMHDPDILILDEPTLGVDVQNRNEIWSRIKGLDEKTVLLTTNYMDEADKLSNRCAVIDNGEIVALDSPGNLKRDHTDGIVLDAVIKMASNMGLTEISNSFSNIKLNPLEDQQYQLLVPLQGEPQRYLTKMSELLAEHGVELVYMNLREPTLDDVFLKLTGSKLRD